MRLKVGADWALASDESMRNESENKMAANRMAKEDLPEDVKLTAGRCYVAVA
jgi:hypothetical protein